MTALRSDERSGARFAGLAAASALAVWCARVALLAVLEGWVRDGDRPFALWQAGVDGWWLTAHAALAGALLAAAALARPGAARTATTLAAALATYGALVGWPWAEARYLPVWDSDRGKLGVAVLALAALLAPVVVRVTARALRPGPRAALVLVALLAALTPLYRATLGSRSRLHPGRVLPVTRVLHELAFEPELWEVVEAPRGARPRLATVTPSLDYRLDGGDIPTLVMPPPARVRFSVPDDGGEVWLTGRTGVDLDALERLPRGVDELVLRFGVTVDGAERWHAEHRLRADGGAPAELCWKDLEPQRLAPGQVVELTSEVAAPELAEPPLLRAGFGALRLEQRTTKPLLEATPEAPNVVLLVMDTLRQDRLSCYGYGRPTTPAIDSLAARGLLYENAYSAASWTWPSTASLLTGLYPETHGVTADGECYLDGSLETLAEVLSARHYVTGAFSCNPLIVADKNFDQGFDSFDGAPTFRRSAAVIDAIRDWIRRNADTRFFLYVQFADTHERYDLLPEAVAQLGVTRPDDYPAEGLVAYHKQLMRGAGRDATGRSTADEVVPASHRAWMQDAYDAAVMTADHTIGAVLAELDAQGLTDRTVIAFTSDHGEELLDHGLVTHGQSLYPELTRVPLILAGPGLARGARVATPVSNRHLAPSLAAIGNAAFAFEQDALALEDPAAVHAQPIFVSTRQGWWNGRYRTDLYGVRDGDWELHWAPAGAPWGAEPAPGGDARLYRVSADPECRRDLAAKEPARAAELLAALQRHLARAAERRPDQRAGVGRRGHAGLVGIGYVDGAPQDDEARDDDGPRPDRER